MLSANILMPTVVKFQKKSPPKHNALAGGRGAAGNRTLVQTSSNKAFYMLRLSLVVGRGQGTNTQPRP